MEQLKAGFSELVDADPLPTSDAIKSTGKAGLQLLAMPIKLVIEGKLTEKDLPDLPFGVVPPLLSSKEQASIPSLMREPKGVWKESFRPTQKEYSLAAPFVKDPTLKDLPKSESEDRAEARKKQLNSGPGRKQLKEARRMKLRELRNRRRALELERNQ
jgi:hypothetical protein